MLGTCPASHASPIAVGIAAVGGPARLEIEQVQLVDESTGTRYAVAPGGYGGTITWPVILAAETAVDGVIDGAVASRVALTPAQIEEMYHVMAIANYEDRFVIPTAHRETGEDAYRLRGACGFSFGNGCSDGTSTASLFGKHKVNIGQMSVGRSGTAPGGEAIGVLNLDNEPPQAAIDEVLANPDIQSVTIIRLPAAGELPSWMLG